jgi:hypothetical protein
LAVKKYLLIERKDIMKNPLNFMDGFVITSILLFIIIAMNLLDDMPVIGTFIKFTENCMSVESFNGVLLVLLVLMIIYSVVWVKISEKKHKKILYFDNK